MHTTYFLGECATFIDTIAAVTQRRDTRGGGRGVINKLENSDVPGRRRPL